ncbi:MAG: hypothetical protein WC747_01370 [Candidatus Babeliales bacterium]|jgi:hypothetical protein
MIKIWLTKPKNFICFAMIATFATATSMTSNKQTSPLTSPIISSLFLQYRAKSTTNYSLSELRKIHKKKQLKLSDFMATNLNSTAHPDKKLITASLKLQKNLNLYRVTPLFYCHDTISAKAVYYYEIKAIATFTYFHLSSLSQQMGTLLHEFRHVMQYSNANFQFPCDILEHKKEYRLTKNQLQELDADLFTAKTMKCPTCLQMYQLSLQTRRGRDGYGTKKDFEPFVQSATTYCKAHAHQDLTKLNKAIASDNLVKAVKLDDQMGTLIDRMPPFHSNDNK